VRSVVILVALAACKPGAPAPKCDPVAPHQVAGKASVKLEGEGLAVAVDGAPAVCGASRLVESKRFKPGDGTLFKVCLPEGTLSISSDVALAGAVPLRFVHDGERQTGPLVDFRFPDGRTYSQRHEPRDDEQLAIGADRRTATLRADVVWPTRADRKIHVDAAFDCR
jgi:hypothetical protein